MGEVEKARKDGLELFRTINSIDDAKKNREKMRDAIEDLFRAGAAEMKRSIEESPNMGPEEAMKLVEKFQDDEFLMNEELNTELMRIDLLPGVTDYLGQFESEDEERLNPIIDEFTKPGETLMTIVAGGLVEGMEDVMKEVGGAIGEALGGVAEGMEEVISGAPGEDAIQEPPVEIPWGESFKSEDKNVHSVISKMSTLNVICTAGALEGQKTFIPWSFEGIFSELLKELKESQRAISEDGSSVGEFQERLDQIEKIKLLTLEGLQTEMERISTIPGASEEAIRIRDECMTRAGPHVTEIDRVLKDIRG